MDVLLTSFGVGMQPDVMVTSLFYRVPPLLLEHRGTFRLDYAALFMFDRVIVDANTYERAISPRLKAYEKDFIGRKTASRLRQALAEYAELFEALKSSGRLVLKDFDAVLARTESIWTEATEHDLERVSRWAAPLDVAVEKWDAIFQRLDRGMRAHWAAESPAPPLTPDNLLPVAYYPHAIGEKAYTMAPHAVDTLKHWDKEKSEDERDFAKGVLRDYLAYVNCNLLLAFDTGAAFLDWADMQGFYERKFSQGVENVPPRMRSAAASRKLFELLFPWFVPKSPKSLVKALDDKRVEELRLLVQQAVAGGVQLDTQFAIDVLKEVVHDQQVSLFRRKITGWATTPLGFVPLVGTVLEKATQELLEHLWADRPMQQHRWYFFVNDLDASEKGEDPLD